MPLCGVPYHSAEPYIAKLLKAGLKVAVCEQSAPESPAAGSSGKGAAFQLTATGDRRPAGRGLMPRQIVRVITPGTVGEEMVLIAGEKNFLLAAVPDGDGFALAAIDVSTGEFIATRIGALAGLREELARIAPREMVVPAGSDTLKALGVDLHCPLTEMDGDSFDADAAQSLLVNRFGLQAAPLADGAFAGAIVAAARRCAALRRGELRARPGPSAAAAAVSRGGVHAGGRGQPASSGTVASSDGTRTGSLLSILDEDADASRRTGAGELDRLSAARSRRDSRAA